MGTADARVVGVFHHQPTGRNGAGEARLADALVGDLTDPQFSDTIVRSTRPDWVVNLAAQASPPQSWRDPAETLTTNVVGQSNLLEAIARHAPSARVLVIGSSEEYGRPGQDELVVDETAPLLPDNPYATSKVAQDYQGLQYFLGKNLDVVRARPFNLFGPGQSDRFAISSFARQIVEAEFGLRPPTIAVGNLGARRDYTDVRDAARAYLAILKLAPAGSVYNVGGGGVRVVGEILDALRRSATLEVVVEVDPARYRPGSSGVIIPDARRLRAATGWSPAIPFEQTIADILDDWRVRIRTSGRATVT